MQKLGNRLLVTAPPKPDEGLTGYLVRLAECNGYKDSGWILTLAGLGATYGELRWPTFVFNPDTALNNLAEVVGRPPAELEDMFYPPVGHRGKGSDNRFFGSLIPREVLHPERPKVCPQCLDESPYYRRIWDLRLITCCPSHRRMLTDKCPGCECRIWWHRGTVCRCRCGFDLREVKTSSVDDETLGLVCKIYHSCGLSIESGNSGFAENNPLACLNLSHALTAVLFIASRFRRKWRINGDWLKLMDSQEIHGLLLRAALIFKGWPNSFYEFVDWKRSQVSKPSAHYMNTHFGEFYNDIYKNHRLSCAELNFFRDDFKRYLELRWDGRHLIRVKPKLKYLTKMESMKRLQVAEAKWKYFIDAGELKSILQPDMSKRRIIVEAESVERLREKLSRLTDVKGMAKALGVSPVIARELFKAGYFTPAWDLKTPGFKHLSFNKEDAENLVGRVKGLFPKDDPRRASCDLSLLVESFEPIRAPFPVRLRAILDGKLLPQKQRIPSAKNLSLPF